VFANLTLTQIYTFNYMRGYFCISVGPRWEPFGDAAFYVVLPLAGLLLFWCPCAAAIAAERVLLAGRAGADFSGVADRGAPDDLVPNGMRLWLPLTVSWFLPSEPDGAACYGGALLLLCAFPALRHLPIYRFDAARGDPTYHRRFGLFPPKRCTSGVLPAIAALAWRRWRSATMAGNARSLRSGRCVWLGRSPTRSLDPLITWKSRWPREGVITLYL